MRARFRCTRGTALPTALGVLSVVGLLSASLWSVGIQVTDSSTASRDAKRALAVADAGLEAAVFRLNRQNIQTSTQCFTTTLVAPQSGECPGYTETFANGTTYTYYVSPTLSPGDTCAGLPVTQSTMNGVATIVQRCVTAIGVANGEQRRVQARIASYEGAPIFPKPGILGLNGVTAVNNSSVVGYIGTNGKVTLGNNTIASTIELGTNGTYQLGTGSQIGQLIQRTAAQGDFVLAPVDFGNSATTNDNWRIVSCSAATACSPPKDSSTNTTYTNTATAPRTLSMATGGTLTLGGGTYNFCKLTLANNTTITIAAGAKVRIFIDSPDREGSGCIPKNTNGTAMTSTQWKAAGYGSMAMGQGANLVNTNREDSLQLYIYGWNDGSQVIQLNNSAKLNLALVAPQTKIFFGNSGAINGGVAAREVEFKNGADFTWGASLSELRATTLALYYRTAWNECRRTPTVATDPESGCSTG